MPPDREHAHVERRRTPDSLMALVQQIHAGQQELVASHQAHKSELAEAITKLMTDSFPEGDPAGHRRYHEASIKAAEDRAEFWKKMRFEVMKYGLPGFIGWVAYLIWQGVLQGPHK